jgi:tetratricopeptide (TPR) repeat protein
VAYHPFIDALKSNFDIKEGDKDLGIRQKVKKGLKILQADEAATLPYLLNLLSVSDSGIDKIPMSPEARKARIIEAIKHIILKGSEIRPLIMAYEDLHWIDKSSEDSSKELLDSITGARIFLIFTYRPEFVHTWGGRSYHNQITLNRLSNRESLKMVAYLLGTEDIDRKLEELILEKTEGIPFFIEEFIKSLKDLQIIERKDSRYYLIKDIEEVTIPSTIQDVIMARVDSLPEAAKEVLQIGSVIEREFRYELIKRVTGFPEEELLSHMSILKDSELLYERGIYPETTYIFKNALTREVVYDSILTKKKKKLHDQIGRSIEELFKENIDKQYGVLAEHFIQSGNHEKGAAYSKLAGKTAARAASYRDAIEYAKKRVWCAERLPSSEATQKKIIDARTVLAGYYTTLSRLVEAKEAVEPIVDLALALNYQRRLSGVHTAIGLHSLWVEEDFSKGFRHLTEVSKISEKVDIDMSSYMPLWFTNYYLGATLSMNCEFEKGLEYLKRCMDLSEIANDLVGMAFTKGATCLNYIFRGKIDVACKAGDETLRMAKDIGGIFIQGMAYTACGMSLYVKGLLDEAENNLLKGLDFCEKTTQVVWGPWAPFFLSHLYFDVGEYQRAKDYCQRGLLILEPRKMLPSLINTLAVAAARADALSGDQDFELEELVKYYQNNKFRALKGCMARYIGEILLSRDDAHISDAENWFKEAFEADTKNGMRWFLACDYALSAELMKRKGDKLKTKQNLQKAIEIFKECGADGWVEKYEKELANL